jgi:hypothetical protein
MKHLRLALAVLALAGSAGIASAQNITFTYDNTNSVFYTTLSYVTNADSTITTNYNVNTTWHNWYNVNAGFSWSTNDAATNSASGSLGIDFGVDPTDGSGSIAGSQSLFFSGFDALGDNGAPINLNNYSSVQFDILVDPASVVNTWNDYGTLQIALFNNYSYTTIGQYTITNDAVNTWYHVTVPIPAGIGTWRGPMFALQDWVGSPSNPNGWHLNNPSSVKYYIDNLTYVAKPPVPGISIQPVGQELFAGRTANWNVVASGGQPLSYQWQKGSTPLTDGTNVSGSVMTGSTNSAISIANVSTADVGNYRVVITNSYGSITSSVVGLKIVSPTGAEAIATAALNPVAFYELNETNNPATGSPLYDHVGGFAGFYSNNSSNWFDGILGPEGAGFPGFPGANGAAELVGNSGGMLTIPALNLNTNTVTFTAWINPNSYIQDAAILMSRYGSTASGLVWASGSGDLGFNWANNGSTWGWRTSGARPPLHQWSFIALVITPGDGTVYSFSTAGISTPGNLSVGNGNQAFEGPTLIGSDGGTANRTYDGVIKDVAIYNYSLTTDQLQQLYFAGAGGPTLRFDGVNMAWDDLSLSPVYPASSATTLLEASSLTGPWTPVAGATSPWPVTPAGTQHYYRLKVQ